MERLPCFNATAHLEELWGGAAPQELKSQLRALLHEHLGTSMLRTRPMARLSVKLLNTLPMWAVRAFLNRCSTHGRA